MGMTLVLQVFGHKPGLWTMWKCDVMVTGETYSDQLVIRIHPLGNMNMCNKSHDSPSNSYWVMLWKKRNGKIFFDNCSSSKVTPLNLWRITEESVVKQLFTKCHSQSSGKLREESSNLSQRKQKRERKKQWSLLATKAVIWWVMLFTGCLNKEDCLPLGLSWLWKSNDASKTLNYIIKGKEDSP